jgi:hypothetical protein
MAYSQVPILSVYLDQFILPFFHSLGFPFEIHQNLRRQSIGSNTSLAFYLPFGSFMVRTAGQYRRSGCKAEPFRRSACYMTVAFSAWFAYNGHKKENRCQRLAGAESENEQKR